MENSIFLTHFKLKIGDIFKLIVNKNTSIQNYVVVMFF